MSTKKTKEQLIAEFIAIHGDRYDYSHVVYKNGDTPVTIICNQHGPFLQRPRAHIANQGCPKCNQSSNWQHGKSDTKRFIERARSIHGDKYDYDQTNYLKAMSKVKITCKEHGPFDQLANSHLNGHGCPRCTDNRQKTTSDFIDKASKIHNDAYDYSKTHYTSATSKITITCRVHGDFEQRPTSHLNGQGCKKCGIESIKNKLRMKQDDYINRAIEIHGNTYIYDKLEYIDSDTKVTIICKTHGDFIQSPGDHINGKHGCPHCSGNIKKTTEQFVNEATAVHGHRYTYHHTTYINAKTDLEITCPEHGTFHLSPGEHLIGRGCPKCNISGGQLGILNWLCDSNIKTVVNDRVIIGPLELDIYLPDHKVGIEYHGSYWHSYDSNETTEQRLRHSIKHDASVSADIDLLQFYDFEWKNKTEIVKSIIKSHTKTIKKKTYARKLTISKLDIKTERSFFSSNHLQGYHPSTVCYGLCDENSRTICAASFSKRDGLWEVMRFATVLDESCIGGFSRLLNKFKITHNPIKIITFANRRYSTGNVYKKAGFSLDHVTKPNYWYIKPNGNKPIIMSRISCQKHKLKKLLGTNFNNHLTEAENMFASEYRRLWDAGNYKLSWEKKND